MCQWRRQYFSSVTRITILPRSQMQWVVKVCVLQDDSIVRDMDKQMFTKYLLQE